MSDFDEAMVLRRIGELIADGDLPPFAHGMLRFLAMAIEHDAEIERLRNELAHRDRALEIMADWYERCHRQRPGGAFDRADCITQALSFALAATEECRHCYGRGAVIGMLGYDGDGYEVPCSRCNPLVATFDEEDEEGDGDD